MTSAQRTILDKMRHEPYFAYTLPDGCLDAIAAALADLDAVTKERDHCTDMLAASDAAWESLWRPMQADLNEALADLDVCRKAMDPVARELRKPASPALYTFFVSLDRDEAAAVLAAAGEQP